MSCSLIGNWMSSRVGRAFTTPLNAAPSLSSQAGQPRRAIDFLRLGDDRDLAARLAHLNNVVGANQQRRDVGLAPIQGEQAMAHKLARLVAELAKRGGKSRCPGGAPTK